MLAKRYSDTREKKLGKSNLALQERFLKMQKKQLFQTENRFAEFMKDSEARGRENNISLRRTQEHELSELKEYSQDKDFLNQIAIVPKIEQQKRER